MQRLRREHPQARHPTTLPISADLKQLGLSDYVFPNAQHTRFEHSLGVGHLAKKWFDSLAV